MHTETVTPEPPVFQCRHIFTDGHRCGSRALRHEAFCFYHHQTRKPATGPRLATALDKPDPTAPFDLPLPEDRSAIQHSLGLILQRIATNQLDPRRAGLLLYALQIAGSNLPKAGKQAQPVETVDEITFDDHLGPLAPQAELHRPKGEKSFEPILLEQWGQNDQLAAQPETLDIHATAETPPMPHPHHSPNVVRVGLGRGRANKAPYPTDLLPAPPGQLAQSTPQSHCPPLRIPLPVAALRQNSEATTCPQAGSTPSKQASPFLPEDPSSGKCRTPQLLRHSFASAVPPAPAQSVPPDHQA